MKTMLLMVLAGLLCGCGEKESEQAAAVESMPVAIPPPAPDPAAEEYRVAMSALIDMEDRYIRSAKFWSDSLAKEENETARQAMKGKIEEATKTAMAIRQRIAEMEAE